MNAFTIVGRNYLAHARVLAESFLTTNPGSGFSAFILDDDGTVEDSSEPFQVLRPGDVFEEDEFQTLLAIYDVMELATAVKPRVLSYLLEWTEGPAAYLDPDLWFFGSVDEVEQLAYEHAIVLTPHVVRPVPRDGRRPTETELLQSGIYNLGFIAVGSKAADFLGWWWERLKRDCVVAPQEGLFVDQRWVDFVPGMFDHYILDGPEYNIAYWNLHERELRWTGQHYEVDGRPLIFAHFSGFDPHKPYLLSRHTGDTPRVLLSDQADLARLCADYAKAMLDAGYEEVIGLRYGHDQLPNGVRLDRRMRRLYRRALVGFERAKDARAERPLNPYQDPDGFVAWLNGPHGDGHPDTISRYLHELWQSRPDLQQAFPDIRGPGSRHYLHWVVATGRHEERIPASLVPRSLTTTPGEWRGTPAVPSRGVNITGYLRAELGVGEAARKMAETVHAARLPLATLAYTGTRSRQAHPIEGALQPGRDLPPYDINIVTVNADSTVQFARDVGEEFFNGRYTVGMWAWEVEQFPKMWSGAFEVVDEVWMNSSYAATAAEKVATKPVYAFPLTVSVPLTSPIHRSRLGVPEGFLFLFTFDFFSIFERKNPLALIEAFARAFAPGEGPILLIKSINGDQHLPHLERLRFAAEARPDVYVWDGYLSADEKNALVAACDAYVSLHRSEGFGLTMAEAMALGKPTVATGYSGNLEFMNGDNSYLVEYEPASVPEGCAPYPPGARWAEPSVEHAAELMRRVYENPEEAKEKGERARGTIEAHHSPEARARLLLEHVERIRRSETQWRERKVQLPSAGNVSALGRARETVGRPLVNAWTDDAGTGLTSTLRAAALKVMRPALARERAVDETLVEAIGELADALARVEHSVVESAARQSETAETQERLADALARVEHSLVEVAARQSETATTQERLADALARVEASVVEAAARQSETATTQERLEEELDRLGRRSDELARELQAAAEGTARFSDDASRHLAALTDQVAALVSWRERTEGALAARPYMSDPEAFAADDGSMAFVASGGESHDPYRDFEDLFRGNEAFIRERQRVYVDMLRGHEPVLDAGCGRGEFLDLLAEAGIVGIGAELDRGMVEHCLAKGHNVVHSDANLYLASLEDGSLGTVFSAQFIEHLEPSQLIEFLHLSVQKLRPGGLFIAETVNPHSLAAFRTFWTDLTHRAPIFPEVALTFVRATGFAEGRIIFPNGTGDLEADLRQQGEFAVVGRVGSKGRAAGDVS